MPAPYPHTIANGHGEALTFLGVSEGPKGPTMRWRAEVQAGAGPPMHVHFQQEETITVVTGRLGYQIQGLEVCYCEPGETAAFGPGVPHKFWADGDQVLHMKGTITPPHNVEYYLGEIYRSIRENDQDGRPDDFEAAYLLKRYGREYDMLEIPPFVKAVVFPVLRMVGGITGKFKQLEQGPNPLP